MLIKKTLVSIMLLAIFAPNAQADLSQHGFNLFLDASKIPVAPPSTGGGGGGGGIVVPTTLGTTGGSTLAAALSDILGASSIVGFAAQPPYYTEPILVDNELIASIMLQDNSTHALIKNALKTARMDGNSKSAYIFTKDESIANGAQKNILFDIPSNVKTIKITQVSDGALPGEINFELYMDEAKPSSILEMQSIKQKLPQGTVQKIGKIPQNTINTKTNSALNIKYSGTAANARDARYALVIEFAS